jgi:hypothetical protein
MNWLRAALAAVVACATPAVVVDPACARPATAETPGITSGCGNYNFCPADAMTVDALADP